MHEETMKEALERELEQRQFIRFREEDAKEVLALIAVNEKLLEALKVAHASHMSFQWVCAGTADSRWTWEVQLDTINAAIALAEAK